MIIDVDVKAEAFGLHLIKPLLKEPCNGCGECCKTAICATATYLFVNLQRDMAPCPLMDENNQCQILNRKALSDLPKRMQNLIIKHHKAVISFGKGCGYASAWEPWDINWMTKTYKCETKAIASMKLAFEAGRICKKKYLSD